MIDLLKDLISFKTVYPNKNEFQKCFNYIKEYFKNSNLYIAEYVYEDEISMVISNTKQKELDIILCGHIDVVPSNDNNFTLTIDEDKAFGRGVADMKSQVAVMMKLIKEINTDKKIALILSSDEERGGFNGVKKVLDEGYSSKIAIVPDGGFNFKTVTEEKGVIQIKVIVKGKEAHASMTYEGENAIQKAITIYNKILEKYPLPKNENDWVTSFNLSKIEGGDALNKVPNETIMYFDIRHINQDKKEEIIEFIKSLDNNIEIEILKTGEVFFVDIENKYFKIFSKVYEKVLNKAIEIDRFPAASDARFFTNKNIPSIMINQIAGNAHCENEWTSINSLFTLYNLFEEYIKQV